MKKLYLVIAGLIISVSLNAQVIVTAPPPVTISDCSFPTAYSPLGDITITESLATDISGSGDFILTAPTNFEFQPGVGSVTTSGGDLILSSLVINANTITFFINVNSTINPDAIIIQNIMVRAITTPSGPADIIRTVPAGSAVVLGDESADGISHGSLSSVLNPTPNVTNTFSSPTYCNGDAGAGVTFTSDVVGATFTWTSSGDIGFGISGSGNIGGYTATNAGIAPTIATVAVTATANGCTGPAATYSVTVNPTPTVTNTFTNPTYCNGDAGAAVGFTSDVSGTTFAWTSSINVGFGTSGSGDIPAYTATNVSGAAITATISVQASGSGCNSSAKTFTIKVNPTPNVTNVFANPTYCNGVAGGAVTFTSNLAGTTYSWTSSTNVGFGTSGPGNIAAYTATNVGPTQIIATVTVTASVTATGCSGPSKSYTITVNPSPGLFNVTGGGPYCTGGVGVPVGLSGSQVGVSYQLKRGAVNVGAAAAGTGAAISFGNQTIAGTYTVLAATSAGGCTIAMTGSAMVAVNSPVANAGPAWSLCSGSVTIGGSPAAGPVGGAPYTFSWTSSPAGFTSTLANPVVSPAVTTTYSLIATDNIGCVSAPGSVLVTVGAGTKTWVGTGALPATGPDNNFNNALNWKPLGVPASCNDVIISLFGSVTIPINSNITINSLSFTGGLGTGILNVQGNTLTINNNTSVMPTAGVLQIGVNDPVSAGVIDFSGNVSIGPGIGISTFIGNANSRLIFRKNLTMGALSSVATGTNTPGSAEFLGSGNQIITWNTSALTGTSRFRNVVIGDATNNPVVSLVGSQKVDNILGDLTINGSSILDIGTNQWNRNAAGGGTFQMNGTSTLRLAGPNSVQTGILANLGGVIVPGSNYPGGFVNSLSPTSTVEYYGTVAQTIYASPTYGNLTLTNNSTKTAGAPLTIATNLLINPNANFRANSATGWTHNIGGNWTNNGIFSLAVGLTNTINFNGNNSATISGVSATAFHTMTINKGTSIATTLDLTSTASVSNALNFFDGLFRIQPTGIMTVNGAGPNIAATSGLHINGGIFNTVGVSVANAGLFRVSSGTGNIGTITGNSLDNNSGGIFDMSGGTLNIAARLTFSTGAFATSTLSGGNINLATVGNNSGSGSLDMSGATRINVSGGLITFKNANAGAGVDANILFSTGAKPFTGGTLQFGTLGTPVLQVFKINSQVPLYNLAVNNTNNPVARLIIDILGSNDITINTGGTLDAATFDKNINISGNWINNGTFNSGAFPSQNALVNFNGASPQILSGSQKTTFNNLSLSNGTGLTFSQNVDLLNAFSFGASNAILTTNGLLTIKSGPANTGRIADITNNGLNSGNDITGNVIVERYIPAKRAWRFLSIPTQPSQTIHAAWQESQPAGSTTPVGLGIQITSNRASWLADGFDVLSTGGPSMKTFDPVTNNYIGIISTAAPFAPGLGGYMTFIRGDRTANTVASPATSTTLRTQGVLNTGTQTPITVIAGQITPYNNPYASPIDLRKLSQSLGVFVYVWDPNTGGANGFGGFQTLFWNNGTGNYDALPGGGSYGPGNIDNFIESGQAFMISGSNATLPLTEIEKGTGSNIMVFLPNSLPTPQLRSNLYGVNADGSTYLADGALTFFDDTYNNEIDGMDAKKLANFSENLSLKISNTLLAIERRKPIKESDTLFLNLTGTKAQQYHFELIAQKLDEPGLTAFLEDKYNQTKTPINLNGTTTIDFAIINNPGSHAPDRFSVVFKPTIVLPVTFTSLKAYRRGKDINVEWRVENEMYIRRYEVEKSLNGILFTTLGVLPATNNGNTAHYISTDTNPVEGYNYYRVKNEDVNNKTSYTNIVKVLIGSGEKDIKVNPNPIKDGIVRLQFKNQPPGLYNIKLINKSGQVILSGQIDHADGNNYEVINWDYNLAHGIYQLDITNPDGNTKVINVIY